MHECAAKLARVVNGDTDIKGNFNCKFRATVSGKRLSVPNYGALQLLIDEDLR